MTKLYFLLGINEKEHLQLYNFIVLFKYNLQKKRNHEVSS